MDSAQQITFTPRRNLPPAEVDCKWWKKGNCTRGSTCFFKHDPDQAGVDNPDKGAEKKETRDGEKGAVESSGDECIRSWRTSAKNSSEDDPLDPMSENYSTLKKTSKTCPMCRVQSDYVVPSTFFPTPPSSDSSSKSSLSTTSKSSSSEKQPIKNEIKEDIVNSYLSRLKTIPCRYFEHSVQRKRIGFRNAKLNCGFGNNCHYAHIDPDTQEPYIFSTAELNTMKARRAHKRSRARDMMVQREMAMIVSGLGAQSFEDSSELGQDDLYPGLGVGDELAFEAFSEFFGPSPFMYEMMGGGGESVIGADDDWETESSDEEDDDDEYGEFYL
ncbi:hypothetical protein FQN54_003120 [Arachnomyces sp. PD_36]|nr:hypothetical protein FQN54_003120 [Arachnomyces sp. PD_36]